MREGKVSRCSISQKYATTLSSEHVKLGLCLFFESPSMSAIPFFFFFNNPPTPEIYPLPLHDALPISRHSRPSPHGHDHLERRGGRGVGQVAGAGRRGDAQRVGDRAARAGRYPPAPRRAAPARWRGWGSGKHTAETPSQAKIRCPPLL